MALICGANGHAPCPVCVVPVTTFIPTNTISRHLADIPCITRHTASYLASWA